MNAARFLAGHAAVFAVLVASAYVAGRLLWRAPRAAASVPSERGVYAGILGLVALSTLGCALGLMGALRPWPLLVALGLLHAAGVGAWREMATARDSSGNAPGRGTSWWAVPLFVAGPLFVLALYPPTAFDETLYHLPMARAFAGAGALPFLPELRFPVFPQLAELLAAEILLFAPDTATHLVALLAVLLTAALLVVWGREWTASRQQPEVGWLAAAIFLGNPLVVYLSGTGYVDPLLTLFVTASCHAFWRWRRGAGAHYLAVSGAFAGAAASTKYLGLFFVAVLGLAACVAKPFGAARGGRWRQAAVFALLAAAVMAPWYGRLVVLTGNPVFPFLSSVFGENEWTVLHYHSLTTVLGPGDPNSAVVEKLGRLVTLPWDVLVRRERVGALPPLSPAYLLGTPWMLFAAWRHREPRWLLALAMAFVGLFPLLPADPRYLVTVLPLFGLALAIGIERFLRRRTTALALVVALLLPGWLYAGYRMAIQGALPTDPAARETFLSRRLPLYPAVARINHALRPGDTVYGLHAEQMRDFVRGHYMGDWFGARRYALLLDRIAEPRAVHDTLESWGVDYFLVPRSTAWPLSDDQAVRAGFQIYYQDGAAQVYVVGPRAAAG